jgi:hypothetical protein
VKPLADVEPLSGIAQQTFAHAEVAAAAALSQAGDVPAEEAPNLPSDHAAWAKDTLSLSQRARAFAAALAPIVVRTLSYWDHRVRSIVVRSGKLTIDFSGSYRLE